MMWKSALMVLLLSETAAGQVPGKVILELADVPPQMRQKNWPATDDGKGSCVNAATITILNYLGLEDHAKWWRDNFQGGEWSTSQIQHMLDSGLLFAYTDTGDPAFLDWAARNRLVVGITYKPRHAINLVNLDAEYATLLDNNYVDYYERVPREEFLQKWRTEYQGFAWTFVYEPPPPWPKSE